MVGTLEVVLAGLLAYMLGASLLRSRGLLPAFVKVSGPITTLHTQRGKALLDRLARHRRFWRAWGNLGVGAAVVVMVGSFLMVVSAGYAAVVNPQPSALNQPRNVLAIPGVNEFLPLSMAPEIVAGLLLGLVVHEGGHGLMCRVGDIDIDSMGLALLTLVPIGAFVEPDEDSRAAADRAAQTRMFAAGVMNNFALTFIAFALLFGPVVGSIAVVDGVTVGGAFAGSPADRATIGQGDVITGVEGQPVHNESEFQRALARTDARRVEVGLLEGDPVTVERRVVVASVSQAAPLSVNTTVEAVNGTAVYTESAFRRVAANHTVARLETDRGTEIAPLGALVSVQTDGPFAASGAPTEDTVVVTSIGGERVVDHADLAAVLDDQEPDATVPVVAYRNGARTTYNVTLGTGDAGGAQLGVLSARGISGMSVNDFGIQVYPAGAFLQALGGDGNAPDLASNFFQRMLVVLVMPFLGAVGGFSTNFAGFTPAITDFYVVQDGLFAPLGGWTFGLANVLFWTAWINLVIGQFNCIPAFPLDGGHILRTGTEAIVARLPIDHRRSAVKAVTVGVGLSMLAGLLLMLFAPRILT
jgi:membrane-associated protease RseP (regulator of RpoE activity)